MAVCAGFSWKLVWHRNRLSDTLELLFFRDELSLTVCFIWVCIGKRLSSSKKSKVVRLLLGTYLCSGVVIPFYVTMVIKHFRQFGQY